MSPGGGIASLLAFACGLAVVVVAWDALDVKTIYMDYVVGPQSRGDSGKIRDMRAFWLLLVLVPLFHGLFHGLINLLIKRKRLNEHQVRDALYFMSVTLLPWLGLLVTTPDIAPPYAWLGSMALGIFLASLVAFRGSCNADNEVDWIRNIALSIFMSVFSGLGLVVAASTLMPDLLRADSKVIPMIAGIPVVGIFLLASLNVVRGRRWKLKRLLLLSQFPMPLLVFALFPEPLIYRGELIRQQPTLQLGLILLIFVAFGFLHLHNRLKIREDDDRSTSQLVSPWSIAAVAVFCAVGPPGYPTLAADDFHFGEQVLPWYQVGHHDKIPFVDMYPFHGWMHIISGSINSLLFGGDVAAYNDVIGLMWSCAAAVSALLVLRLAGYSLALLLSLVFLPQAFYGDRMLFVAPVLLALAQPELGRQPVRWLFAWLIGGVFLAFYNTVSGGAFVLATLPFVAWQVYRGWMTCPRTLTRAVLYVVFMGAMLLVWSPTRAMACGYLTFITENQASYQIIQGRPWFESWGVCGGYGLLSIPAIYEGVRYLWVFVLFLLLYIVTNRWLCGTKPSFTLVVLGLGGTCWIIGMSVYALGRIDMGVPGRAGSVTYLACTTFLPVILWREYAGDKKPLLACFLVLCGFLMGFMDAGIRLTWQDQYRNASRLVCVPDALEVYEGGGKQTNGIGRAFVDQEKHKQIQTFCNTLDQVAGHNQTYFDFSNRQSYYIYSAKPLPVTYAAPANIDNGIKQRTILKQLAGASPPALLVYPRNDYDWEVSIRSYVLYRYALLNYRPIWVNGFGYMVNDKSPMYLDALQGDSAINILSDWFVERDLGLLPSAWGRSWDSLASAAKKIMDLDENGIRSDSPVAISYDYAVPGISGRTADLLVLECEPDATSMSHTVTITWTSESDLPCNQVMLKLAGNRVVVLLGMFPDWLLAHDIASIHISVSGHHSVLSASLWQRQDVFVQAQL